MVEIYRCDANRSIRDKRYIQKNNSKMCMKFNHKDSIIYSLIFVYTVFQGELQMVL